MDSFQNDIEKMSLETFQIMEDWRRAKELEKIPEAAPIVAIASTEVDAEETSALSYPKGAGLLYRIEKGQSTFCLRIFASQNIEESFDRAECGDVQIQKSLKLTEGEGMEQVHFFETSNFAMAEVLMDQFANRRYPYHEEQVCNISDPGHSWWMQLDQEQGQFKIFFRIQSLETHKNLIQLGPIGDLKLAHFCFRGAQALFSQIFPIDQFNLNDKHLLVKTSDAKNKSFHGLVSLFLNGDDHILGEKLPVDAQLRTLHFFFKELALARKFWTVLTGQLIDKFESPLQ